ncbi:hypothetical protein [uncultured Maribacter sp.]|uniref:beta strand repeat-containing protein n=1 Tax=uncultured Maribacter sp. TaxID=431308 RepID=UPI00260E7A7A|nr:hypothetical protein [uncultured Maribacter sp.]
MKAIIFFILFTVLAIPTAFAQIKIGDNPQNIDASSVLELESTSKVLVITRVTTLEMEAITPQRGGMVYNTDTECINYFDGTQWVNLCDAVNFSITNDPIINGRSTIEITEAAGSINLEVAKNSILGDNIIDGGIGPDDIQDNSITQEKLAAESVGSSELRQNSVGSEEIRDGSIAPADIANSVPGQVLTTDENGIVQWEDSDGLYDLTFNKLDTTLTIARSTIAGVSTISLGALIGSDDQQLDLTANILSIENDPNTIDLSTYLQELSINPAGTEINLTNGGTINLPQTTGSETKVTEGDNITISGDGTTASPYVINTADAVVANGSETLVTEGNNITITGNGTTATPYVINAADGAVVDGTETILQNGTNVTITGDGSSDDPYIINASEVIELNNGTILIGDGAGEASEAFINGDATMNDQGLLTIEEAAVTPLKIEPGLDGQFLSTEAGAVTWVAAPGGTGGSTEVADGTTISGTGAALSPFTITPGVDGEFLSTNVDGDVVWAVPTGATGGTTEVADGVTISGDGTTATPFTIVPATLPLTDEQVLITTTAGAVEWTDYTPGGGGGDDDQNASEVDYENTTSGLTAITAQAAIDELAGITEIDGIVGNEVTAATDATLELSGTGTTADPLTLDVAALGIDTDELAAGAVTLPKLADGTAAGQLLQWDGTEWVYIQEADITATVTEIDGIIGNEVSAVADATLELTGTGTTADPLTLDVAALGIDTDELAAGAVTLPKMADGTTAGQLLQWDGTEWVYITEADIAVTEVDGIIGNEVSAVADATLELTGTGTNADPLTLDVSALGIDTAELAAGAVTLPKMADGTAAGQLLQWDGTNWIYIAEADITATVTEVDGIIGNEVSVAADATLVLTGAGTNADPLALDVAPLGINTAELAAEAVTPAKIEPSITTGQILATNGANVEWQNITNPANAGSILFSDGDGGIAENNNQLFWDNSTLKLGVGTVDPDSKLDVNGQIRASTIANGDGSVGLPSYRFQDDLNSGMWLAAESELAFSTNSLERLRIIGNGDVGIGVTAPEENLHVAGNIRTDMSFLSIDPAIGVPDYVFQKYFLGNSILNPNYEFNDLAEIEAFVKENNHLPGIQSAAAVKEQGFWNVSESSRVNLEKIEELFLHTIEQEKKIKELQSANTNMSAELKGLKAQMTEIKTMLLEKQKN